jgi:hypothetical protein
MLVKFEEEDKKRTPTQVPPQIDLDELSREAGKMETSPENEKYTPTPEELFKLEEELRKLNEQKFGSLVTELDGKTDKLEEESKSDSEIKRLNYIRSHG